MSVKIQSSEINRMLKVVTQCCNPKDSNRSNVRIYTEGGGLFMNSSNGQMDVIIGTTCQIDDFDQFCVDAQMLHRICSNCPGDVTIDVSERSCTIKGAGRTKIPVVNAKIPKFATIKGDKVSFKAEDLCKAFSKISFCIASEKLGRPVLTGVRFEVQDNVATIVTIDGFRMSKEFFPCEGDSVRATIPGAFVKLLTSSVSSGEITLTFSNSHVCAVQLTADNTFMLNTVLLAESFPDHKRMLPEKYKTSVLVDTDEMVGALRSSSVVEGNMIRLSIANDTVRIRSNDGKVDFEALVPCAITGDDLDIAFNQNYITESINSIDADEISIGFSSSVGPCIISEKGSDNVRLVLPVRVGVNP